MKTLLTAVALAAILSTPAMAGKNPVKPTPNTLNTCNDDLPLKVMIYHLDQIEMMLEQSRKEVLQAYPKKSLKDVKTSG